MVVHSYNPNYSGIWGRRIIVQVWPRQKLRPYLKQTNKQTNKPN
jgi:hypothetical protein